MVCFKSTFHSSVVFFLYIYIKVKWFFYSNICFLYNFSFGPEKEKKRVVLSEFFLGDGIIFVLKSEMCHEIRVFYKKKKASVVLYV